MSINTTVNTLILTKKYYNSERHEKAFDPDQFKILRKKKQKSKSTEENTEKESTKENTERELTGEKTDRESCKNHYGLK